MPEGPEVRFCKEILVKYVTGRTLTRIESFSKTKVKMPKVSKVVDVGTQGKLIWIKTEDYYLHIRFGMTGWLHLQSDNDDEVPEHVKYIMHFSGRKVYFTSVRKFSTLNIYSEKVHLNKMAMIGVDVFSDKFTLPKFAAMIADKNTAITAFLLDQGNVAGVGNYLKSDSLYLAKIHPRAKTFDLSSRQTKMLYEAVRITAFSSLLTWLKSGKLKTPRDVAKNKPKGVIIPYKFVVYDQDRDPKGNLVTKEKIGSRVTYYVKKIQKLR